VSSGVGAYRIYIDTGISAAVVLGSRAFIFLSKNDNWLESRGAVLKVLGCGDIMEGQLRNF